MSSQEYNKSNIWIVWNTNKSIAMSFEISARFFNNMYLFIDCLYTPQNARISRMSQSTRKQATQMYPLDIQCFPHICELIKEVCGRLINYNSISWECGLFGGVCDRASPIIAQTGWAAAAHNIARTHAQNILRNYPERVA